MLASNSHDYVGQADARSDRWQAAAEGNSSPSPAFGDGGHFLGYDPNQCLGEMQDGVELGCKIDGGVDGSRNISRGMPRNGNTSLNTIGKIRGERLWKLNASRHLVSCLNQFENRANLLISPASSDLSTLTFQTSAQYLSRLTS